ncbi:BirA family transcriptional regulator, biotin operon repressor / biotin---[acetyl-CoA-carboxylase] ligase [Flavobacteriales bacterium]|nr:Bifunctional ligase/repressor BirA [Flavobacteriales bacterium]MCL4815968.1 biotin--[acetyl-CoA-carboxylase] ligase [Flavobacteriales bacterium]WKZ74299.1 MAG: biotin--[acetyl-CoA-carboxylase] ligase [Vicingaceae bacterium]GIK70639.1 MAG: biotin--[acetyl-CoA-carboxylase] ligase [Bacteroidota bacterium]CAG0978011.1 BirA family transcriptional regulator, biotin operon repressor / biotin---[acetyl-CoA-carboxylase] ligase [Flavobacteriales bacterium]
MFNSIGSSVIKIDELDSTNLYLQQISKLQTMNEGVLVWTERQLCGRGQQGNIWYSKEGESLTFSFILSPTFLMADEQFYLSKAFSIAVNQYLVKKFQLKVQIKWPNDILLNGKKIAGILIENNILGNKLKQSIVGIGINMNNQVFPEQLRATSVLLNSAHKVDLRECIDEMIPFLNEMYSLVILKQWKEIDRLYFDSLYGYKKNLRFHSDGYFNGRIVRVDEVGYIYIETDAGVKKYTFKEVMFC